MTSEPKGYLVLPVWCDSGIIKALVDDDGRIPVQLGGSDLTLDVNLETSDITLPTAEQSPLTYIQARQYGYHDSAWISSGVPLNYSARKSGSGSHTAVSTSSYTMDMGSPSAGTLWVVQALTARNLDSITTVRFIAHNGSSTLYLDATLNPDINVFSICGATPFVVSEVDTVRVEFVSPEIDDRLRAYLWGYIIDL